MNIFKAKVLIDNGAKHISNTAITLAEHEAEAVSNFNKKLARNADETVQICELQNIGTAELRIFTSYPVVYVISEHPI